MKAKSISACLVAVASFLAVGAPLNAIAGHIYQTANVVDLSTEAPVAGAATLTRREESATARIYTTGLDKKSAYTIWWVVWNNPSLCTDECDADDIGISGNSVFYAGGFVTGTDGTTNVSVNVDAGDLADGIDVLIGDGLDASNGLGAEFHLIIRSHGKIIEGMADVQIGSFFGACDINTCMDQQAAVFAP